MLNARAISSIWKRLSSRNCASAEVRASGSNSAPSKRMAVRPVSSPVSCAARHAARALRTELLAHALRELQSAARTGAAVKEVPCMLRHHRSERDGVLCQRERGAAERRAEMEDVLRIERCRRQRVARFVGLRVARDRHHAPPPPDDLHHPAIACAADMGDAASVRNQRIRDQGGDELDARGPAVHVAAQKPGNRVIGQIGLGAVRADFLHHNAKRRRRFGDGADRAADRRHPQRLLNRDGRQRRGWDAEDIEQVRRRHREGLGLGCRCSLARGEGPNHAEHYARARDSASDRKLLQKVAYWALTSPWPAGGVVAEGMGALNRAPILYTPLP